MARAQVFDTTSLAAAGLRVIRRAGWPAVTMRSVAAELHVSPMALYRLTPTAPHLHHLIANATAPPPPTDRPSPSPPPPPPPPATPTPPNHPTPNVPPPVVPPTPVVPSPVVPSRPDDPPPVVAPTPDDPPPDSPRTQAAAAAAAPVEPLASGQSTELPRPRDAAAAPPVDPLPDVPPRPASVPSASVLPGVDAPPSPVQTGDSLSSVPRPPSAAAHPPVSAGAGGGLGEVLWVWAVEAYGHLRGLPGVASYVVLHWTELPAWLDVVEALLAKAEDAGLSGPSAVASVNAVFAYVLVRAQLHDGLATAPRRSIALLRDDPARYPSLHRNRSEFAHAQTDRHFEFGLAALIAGLNLAR